MLDVKDHLKDYCKDCKCFNPDFTHRKEYEKDTVVDYIVISCKYDKLCKHLIKGLRDKEGFKNESNNKN